jgi:hypothetical protein
MSCWKYVIAILSIILFVKSFSPMLYWNLLKANSKNSMSFSTSCVLVKRSVTKNRRLVICSLSKSSRLKILVKSLATSVDFYSLLRSLKYNPFCWMKVTKVLIDSRILFLSLTLLHWSKNVKISYFLFNVPNSLTMLNCKSETLLIKW